jgi:hypothetical protein
MTSEQKVKLAAFAAKSGDQEIINIVREITIGDLPAPDRNEIDRSPVVEKLDKLIKLFAQIDDPTDFIDFIRLEGKYASKEKIVNNGHGKSERNHS